MPAGTIGGISVDIVRGIPQPLKTRVDTWEVPGLDGYGAQTLGKGDAEFELQTISYATSRAAADTLLTSCAALQGTLVTLVDNWANSFANLLITHVDTTQAKKAIIYNGSATAVRVEIHWKLLTGS